MKSIAIGNRINSQLFERGVVSRVFTAEVSELEHRNLNAFDQLWHDEATEGFVMVSQWTGDEVPFIKVHTEREADGETRMWHFKPHPHAIARNPKLARVAVIIYNT